MLERWRDWWEHLAPRERRLMSLLGVTVVVCVFGFIGYLINDGLAAIEARNTATRAALDKLAEHRDDLVAEKSKDSEAVAMIGEDSQSLATYLEGIEGEVGVQIRNSTERPMVTKGKFHEKSLQITLYNVTVGELAQFLKRVETKSPAVVTQRIAIKRALNQPDHLDKVDITVATYERARPKGAEGKGDKDKERDGGPAKSEGVTP